MSAPVPARRCTDLAEERSDPLIGTAFPAARLMLVEQPGPWGRRGLTESQFPSELAVRLEKRAAVNGVRVQAIRRPGPSGSLAARAWALVDSRGDGSIEWGTFDHPSDLLDLELDRILSPAVNPDPVYLVCTHGRHDVCCALRGRPVAAALERARPGQVWETSHVGGDRFAANVLALPSGALYGRVTVDTVGNLVTATESGELVLSSLRGRIGVPPIVQAALLYGHVHLGVTGRQDLHVVGTATTSSGRSSVDLDTPRGRLRVTVATERVAASGLTCHAPGPSAYLRYVLAGTPQWVEPDSRALS